MSTPTSIAAARSLLTELGSAPVKQASGGAVTLHSSASQVLQILRWNAWQHAKGHSDCPLTDRASENYNDLVQVGEDNNVFTVAVGILAANAHYIAGRPASERNKLPFSEVVLTPAELKTMVEAYEITERFVNNNNAQRDNSPFKKIYASLRQLG